VGYKIDNDGDHYVVESPKEDGEVETEVYGPGGNDRDHFNF